MTSPVRSQSRLRRSASLTAIRPDVGSEIDHHGELASAAPLPVFAPGIVRRHQRRF